MAQEARLLLHPVGLAVAVGLDQILQAVQATPPAHHHRKAITVVMEVRVALITERVAAAARVQQEAPVQLQQAVTAATAPHQLYLAAL